jgi:hypothetical protein
VLDRDRVLEHGVHLIKRARLAEQRTALVADLDVARAGEADDHVAPGVGHDELRAVVRGTRIDPIEA